MCHLQLKRCKTSTLMLVTSCHRVRQCPSHRNQHSLRIKIFLNDFFFPTREWTRYLYYSGKKSRNFSFSQLLQFRQLIFKEANVNYQFVPDFGLHWRIQHTLPTVASTPKTDWTNRKHKLNVTSNRLRFSVSNPYSICAEHTHKFRFHFHVA